MTPLGEWVIVADADDGVAVYAPPFSQKAPFATVPFVMATGSGTPSKGDAAFLHFTSDGQPAYAVVWPST